MNEHDENFNKDGKYTKVLNRSHRAKEYNSSIEKYIRKLYQHTGWNRRKDQSNWRLLKSTHQSSKRFLKLKINEASLRDLCDNIKQRNLHTIGLLEGEERKKERGRNLFEEISAENFPNLGKETDNQIQEAHGISNKEKLKRPTPIHTTVKLPKVKDKREC